MMRVKDLMTSPVRSCGPNTNLAAAAMIMWESDCGALPVVNPEGKVVGMLTDRDICMAVATKHRDASDISVGETSSGKMCACSPQDDIKEAFRIMAKERIRRLPVVNEDGRLHGILCMNDLILQAEKAEKRKAPALSYDEVMRTLKIISAHRVSVKA